VLQRAIANSLQLNWAKILFGRRENALSQIDHGHSQDHPNFLGGVFGL
jgi:hypothetical protein